MQLLPFLSSKEAINLCNICQCYEGVRPSKMMDIEDAYTAYCLDEAIAYIRMRIVKGDKPILKEENKTKKYSSFSDLYSKYN